MNNKLLSLSFFILSIILLYGCTDAPVELISESFSENELESCKDINCPNITVNYILVDETEEVSKKINDEINQFIVESLFIGDPESESKAKTITEAAEGFIKMYRIENAEFPDMQTEYDAQVWVTVLHNDLEIISMENRYYLFTGGAHGYGSTQFKNFDPKTGALLQVNDIIKKEFTSFAEEKFRAEHKIASDVSINETGFWFENDTFYLPESMGITSTDLIFIYNQYDIASYAAGPIELKIPIAEAKPFLKIIPELQ